VIGDVGAWLSGITVTDDREHTRQTKGVNCESTAFARFCVCLQVLCSNTVFSCGSVMPFLTVYVCETESVILLIFVAATVFKPIIWPIPKSEGSVKSF
jgi:hypothetical protein